MLLYSCIYTGQFFTRKSKSQGEFVAGGQVGDTCYGARGQERELAVRRNETNHDNHPRGFVPPFWSHVP